MLENRKVIIDDELILADTGSAEITASAAATVDGVAKVIDTGGGHTEGKVVIDISDISGSGAATNNQLISIILEGSSTSTFTAWVRLAGIRITPSSAETLHGRTAGDHSAALTTTTAKGRYIVPFINDFHGTVYRWLRIYTTFNGSGADGATSPAVKFKAWLSKR